MSAEYILFIGSILLVISLLVSRVSSRFGVPVLLLFLFVGMAFGEDGVGISFSDMRLAQSIGMIAMSVILYSGGMGTKFSDIKPVLGPGIMLSTVGVLLTALLTGTFIWLLSKSPIASISFSFPVSLLLASTMASTDSASVFNVLRGQKMGLRHNLRPMLELESGSNDPMAYLLTITLVSIAGNAGMGPLQIVVQFFQQLLLGAGLGLLMGQGSVWLVNRVKLSNDILYSILLLASAFLTYTFTASVGGNGYLAVYLAGMIVGNCRIRGKMQTELMMDGLKWLMQIVMFLVLGLLVNPAEMLRDAPLGLLIGIFMMLLARPATVFACLLPFRKINARSKMFISWVGLRGAVPILFATYPVIAGIDGSGKMFNIVFFITLLSLAFQGTTLSWSAKKLGLSEKTEEKTNDFGVLYPDDMSSEMYDMTVTEEMLAAGTRLMDAKLPKGTVVVLVRRDGKHIVPNGKLELVPGDKMLVVRQMNGES